MLIKMIWTNRRQYHSVVSDKGLEFANLNMANKDTDGGSRVLTLTGNPTIGKEMTQGVLNVTISRLVAIPFTSALWGGAADIATRINAYNAAPSTVAYGGIQALRVYTRQYSGGNICNLYGSEFDCDDRGTADVTGKSVGNMYTVKISQRVNTIVGTQANLLILEDNTQGSLPATCLGSAIIKMRSTQPIATGARLSGIHCEISGSGNGWTNLFTFQQAAGQCGFTGGLTASLAGNVTGYIKVYDVANAATGYINVYGTVPS